MKPLVTGQYNRALFLDLIELGLRVTMAMDAESIIGTERHRALVIARRASQ